MRRWTRSSRPRRRANCHDFIERLAGRLRDRARRGRAAALGRRAPAHLRRARVHQRCADPDPRRADLVDRLEDRVRDPRRARQPDGGPHLVHDRAPPVHDPQRRPDPGAEPRRAGGARARTTSCSRRRGLYYQLYEAQTGAIGEDRGRVRPGAGRGQDRGGVSRDRDDRRRDCGVGGRRRARRGDCRRGEPPTRAERLPEPVVAAEPPGPSRPDSRSRCRGRAPDELPRHAGTPDGQAPRT